MDKYLKAKSIHTFAWPFEIDDNGSFVSRIEEKGWARKQLDYRKMLKNDSRCRDAYMLEQYLSIPARGIYLKPEEDICIVYEYPMAKGKDYKYYIKADKKHTYHLDIEAIEMHVYHCGIGILFFQTLNMDEKSAVDDIKIINDKGRRIYLPYIPDEIKSDKQEYDMLCARELGIISPECPVITSFADQIQAFYAGTANKNALSEPAQFLTATINCNLEGRQVCDISVTPVVDDRMFVISLIRDRELSMNVGDKTSREKAKTKDLLYSVFFVDAGDASCQYEPMKEDKLSEASYMRWADYGTVFGVTNYSLICITSEEENINATVVRPFWVEYKYLVSLVIAQREGISLFATKAGKFAKGLDRKGLISRRQAKQLVCLQEEYVTFKNRLLLLEASCQEQGIEIYRMLQKQLFVAEEKDVLDSQLNSIYETTNVSNGTRNNNLATKLAVGAIIIDVVLNHIVSLERLTELFMGLFR